MLQILSKEISMNLTGLSIEWNTPLYDIRKGFTLGYKNRCAVIFSSIDNRSSFLTFMRYLETHCRIAGRLNLSQNYELPLRRMSLYFVNEMRWGWSAIFGITKSSNRQVTGPRYWVAVSCHVLGTKMKFSRIGLLTLGREVLDNYAIYERFKSIPLWCRHGI